MKILSIETSCDETSLALVEASGGIRQPEFRVLKNLISSQVEIHRPFGGVVPNLAKREHTKNLPILFRKIFGISKSEFLISKQIPSTKSQISKIDLITVTVGPGLEPALWTGIIFAKELSKKYKKPLIGANHMEGHLYSFLLSEKTEFSKTNFQFSKMFPAVALIVSGGHTILLRMDSLTKWKKLGETRDDAAGEAFDKVALMLKLPYPGGPEIQKLARKGNSEAIVFPRPMINTKDYDFSFSGLKTSVLYYLRDSRDTKNPNSIRIIRKKINSGYSDQFVISDRLRADIAASFQQAVIDVLVSKTVRATREYDAKSIILCGGVAANRALRQKLKTESSKLKANFFTPDFLYNTDNAAMIAAAGYFAYLKKKKLPLMANGDLEI